MGCTCCGRGRLHLYVSARCTGKMYLRPISITTCTNGLFLYHQYQLTTCTQKNVAIGESGILDRMTFDLIFITIINQILLCASYCSYNTYNGQWNIRTLQVNDDFLFVCFILGMGWGLGGRHACIPMLYMYLSSREKLIMKGRKVNQIIIPHCSCGSISFLEQIFWPWSCYVSEQILPWHLSVFDLWRSCCGLTSPAAHPPSGHLTWVG